MKAAELVKLLKQVVPYRDEEALFEGQVIPKSALMLITMLNAETEQDNRYDLYSHILLECGLVNKTSAAVKFAQARYQEFRDVNCPPFRPDSRRKQEGSRISLRIGLCRKSISGSS
jgi:hypothetical protein